MPLPRPEASRVVLAGVAYYDHLPPLPAVRNNLAGLAGFFTSRFGWGLPPSHCTVVTDPRHTFDLIDPVRRAAAEATDTLLVYYGGHGHLDEELRYSISLAGSRQNEPWTCMPYTWLRSALTQTRAERRVVILDSCFSGQAHGLMADEADALRAQVATAGAVVISSARHDLPALAPVGEPYTAFTGELLRVLVHGIAGGQAEITVDTAYSQVKAALAEKGRPTPDRTGTDTSGALVIARNPAFRPSAPEAAPRPAPGAHLRALAERRLQRPVGGWSYAGQRTTGVHQAPEATGKRYETVSLIGQGGMGEVKLAFDRFLSRMVAVKMIKPRGDEEPFEQRFFWTEARAVAALNHPNVAAIYDVGEGEAGRFIVMEYVSGAPLSDLAGDGKLSPDEAAEAVHDVLAGLDAAHRAGVIHCDIKPHNLMLTPDGTVKILDFGISHFQGEISLYEEGTVVGTPAYMPPEIYAGAEPTAATDIYQAGVTFYELCTGEKPFTGTTVYEVFARVLEGTVVPPSELTPELPAAYEAVILRALEREPQDRYESAAEMRAAIAAALYGTG
ncbi:caspase, EACC1-associated type [Streptomyces sp. NRRL WC-3742]|uniref:caspase, EACC1-associated type n=1 Tax=Streptomyces sp. NRRL WC-3742 TaxID=1463934 RepID=UPI00099C68B2|nr:protein kinase [Streptomyces sp. NRRL WC-3742]